MTIYEGDILATWDVGGETYMELFNEAFSDAQIFMEGSSSSYDVFVYGAEPYKDGQGFAAVKDGKVTFWKGKAVIVWSNKSSSQ